MSIIEHGTYRAREQERRMNWILRKGYARRTGRAPPIQWADEKDGIRAAMSALCKASVRSHG